MEENHGLVDNSGDEATTSGAGAQNPSGAMNSPSASSDSKALRMMQNMGYKPGSGLGKQEQGITEPIAVNTNLGTRGLGVQIGNLTYSNEDWDFSLEELEVNERVNWLNNVNKPGFQFIPDVWMLEGPTDHNVLAFTTFCDYAVMKEVFKAKEVFDELDAKELNLARIRANPFETIRSVFFMNRAALKMANIDAACDFMFTQMDGHCGTSENDPIYFADVCAGPGGFTEYVLWRRSWYYKGFGLTLRGDNDFTVSESTCASSASFQCLYGEDGTGDVCNPANLTHFIERVRHETELGVHFMMSDGGFCVDGQEQLQEILSKNIYACQCLLALNILRPHGHFVTKLFDVFTPFSVGLLFLMYLCFEKVGIIKPNSSRPANSERYLVCKNFQFNNTSKSVRGYLWRVMMRLWELRTLPDRDILSIVPTQVITQDPNFFQYIYDSNTSIGKRQIVALRKLAQFCRNPTLVEPKQAMLRKQCLEYWQIPDQKRILTLPRYEIDDLLAEIYMDKGLLIGSYTPLNSNELVVLPTLINDASEWRFTFLYTGKNMHRVNYYAGLNASKAFRLQKGKWLKINHLELVKGTLLYGEFVKETSKYHANFKGLEERYSLHVIDAIRLGDWDIRGFSYMERMNLIEIYCKSVSKESQSEYSVRVRPKPMYPLTELVGVRLFDFFAVNGQANLPLRGFRSIVEQFEVRSILLFNAAHKTEVNIGEQLFMIYAEDWNQLRLVMQSVRINS